MGVIRDTYTKKKPTCVHCGVALRWGGFAYDQNMCWSCFKRETNIILENIDRYYPSWMWEYREEHKKHINHLMAVFAEAFGEEW